MGALKPRRAIPARACIRTQEPVCPNSSAAVPEPLRRRCALVALAGPPPSASGGELPLKRTATRPVHALTATGDGQGHASPPSHLAPLLPFSPPLPWARVFGISDVSFSTFFWDSLDLLHINLDHRTRPFRTCPRPSPFSLLLCRTAPWTRTSTGPPRPDQDRTATTKPRPRPRTAIITEAAQAPDRRLERCVE